MSNFVDRMEIGREYERLKVQQYGDVNATISKEEILNLTLAAIDSCPTADAVEVVRCKDCRWYETIIDTMFCSNTGSSLYGNPNPNDFCPYGERKEE